MAEAARLRDAAAGAAAADRGALQLRTEALERQRAVAIAELATLVSILHPLGSIGSLPAFPSP